MRTILSFLALCLLAGCASIDPTASYEAKQLRDRKPENITQPVTDITEYLKSGYKPAHDKFILTALPKNEFYGDKIAESLRKAGFSVAVAPQQDDGAVALTYWIDFINEGNVVFRVAIAGKGTWARMYWFDKSGALVPVSDPAILEEGAKK